jgi:uncharacterized protein YndB with AHSA1/START domain
MRIVRILSGLVLLIVCIGIIAYVLGSRLPVNHTATTTVVLNAPQARVWQMIEDVPSQPEWRADLKSVQPLPQQDGHTCWLEVQKMGKMPMCEVLTAEPSTRVVAIADPSLPFGGTWTYQLTPMDAGTTSLQITENGFTKPALFRFIGHYIMHEDTQIKKFEGSLQKASSEP